LQHHTANEGRINNCSRVLHILTNRQIKNRNIFSFICVTLGILVSNFNEYFVFIIPLLGIIFNVFYQVGCGGEASSIAQFSFMYLYLLPDGQMNVQNTSQRHNNNESTVCGCCVCVIGMLLITHT